jgi:hypothetical protein
VDVQGQIKAALHGPRGDTNGVLLQDGTVVRMPPHEAERLAGELVVGKPIVVHGFGYAGPLGKAVAAREIGPDAAHLTRVAGPGPGWGMMAREFMRHHWGHEGDRPRPGPEGNPPPPPAAGPDSGPAE